MNHKRGIAETAEIERICDAFESDWRNADEPPEINAFLVKADATLMRDVFARLLEIDLDYRRRVGQIPREQEYRSRFPKFAEVVTEVFGLPSAAEHSQADGSQSRDATRLGAEVKNPVWKDDPVDETLDFIVVSKGQVVSFDARSAPATSPEKNESDTLLIDRYRLERPIGQGAMGTVYLAEDHALKRKVAVKRIRPGLFDASVREIVMREFETEARIAAGLVHPGIAAVHDYGFQSEIPFIVFEHVAGESLKTVIERDEGMDIDDMRATVSLLADALDYAHKRGIVHRDLKPDNIRLDERGQPKILDFGLAKEYRSQSDWSFSGTPAYTSPEQASEQPVDGRSDQYALALIAYEMLTGRRPFEAKSWQEALAAHREKTPSWSTRDRQHIPDFVISAIDRSLSKDPNRRFSTCDQFALSIGCQVTTHKATRPQFQLECFASPMREGFLHKRAYLGLEDRKLWVCTRDRVVCIPVSMLRSATSQRYRAPGWLGIDLFGRSSEGQIFGRSIVVKEKQLGRWWHLHRRKIPEDLAIIKMPTTATAKRWSLKLKALIESDMDDQEPAEEEVQTSSSPTILKGTPDMRAQVLGPCAASATRKRDVKLKLMMYAAASGADAIVDANFEKLTTEDGVRWKAKGVAIKSLDSETRNEFDLRKYNRECVWIGLAIAILTLVTLAFRFTQVEMVLSLFASKMQSRFQVFDISLQTAVLVYTLPTTLLGLLVAVTRWPQLIRPMAICLIAWSLFLIWAVIGHTIAVANELPGASELGETFAPLYRSKNGSSRRGIRRFEGFIVSTAIALAIKLFFIRRLPNSGSQRRTPRFRLMVVSAAWILALASIIVPILAIGWGLDLIPVEIPLEDAVAFLAHTTIPVS